MNASARPRTTYHHGDLRGAALDAGLRLLDARTANDLGLREVAREIGVSAAALYRHFPDKNALLAALAREGLERLGSEQQRAMAVAGGGIAGFMARGLAYVHFAVDHPAIFRLIYNSAQGTDVLEDPIGNVSSAMRGLRQDIERLLPATMSSAQRKAAALHAWALVHGVAMLILDGQIAPDWRLIEQVLAGVEPMLRAARA